MLRRSHDCHRDLRAQPRAEAPASAPTLDDQDRHIMSTPPITTRNPDPHYRWSLTGYRTIWFKPTNQQATAPAKSLLDRHCDRSTVSHTLPPVAQQSLRPRRSKATILIVV